MRLLTAVSGVRVPQQAPSERNRNAVSFLFIVSSSNPLTLFSPCTTPACRSVGENSLFRRALRSLRGSSPLAGAIVAARRTSQHLAQQRGVFACMPALNPTENSFGGGPDLYPTIHTFCGGPGFIPHKTYVLRGPRFYAPPKILSAGAPVLYPTENSFGGDPDLCRRFW